MDVGQVVMVQALITTQASYSQVDDCLSEEYEHHAKDLYGRVRVRGSYSVEKLHIQDY